MKKISNSVKDIFLLIIITVIAYLPVSFFLLSLKNDSLVQYLPFRYHVSESIQHGYFPFWSPYLYTGFPIHSDMQGMTWNPIVLIISIFTRYNMSVLEFEVTLYLIIAVLSMYSLLKTFSLSRIICVLGAISYMSCGFINGSASVIPWISSAAFIPFVFFSIKKILDYPCFKNSISFCISLCLLFLCGYPTFFIYTSYIIAIILLYSWIKQYKESQILFNKKTAGFLLLAGVLFLFICSPAIISYWEFLPYYSRGAGITFSKASQNPFTPFSSISFILPNSVHKNHEWLNTDTSMRNSYVGLFIFLLFCHSLFSQKSGFLKLILGITFFSFFLSLGKITPLQKICYYILPFFDTFRHPGTIRLFTSIGIILLGSFYAQKISEKKDKFLKKKILRYLYMLIGILGAVTVYIYFQTGVRKNISATLEHINQPKLFFDTFSFNSFILFQCIAQITFLLVAISQIRKKIISKKVIAGIIALNSVFFCWLALPFNFVSQVKTRVIDQYLSSFPDGYPPLDNISPAGAAIISDSIIISPYGYADFYTKKITIQDHIITPTLNKDYEEFCTNKKLRSLLANYPIAWLNDTLFNSTPDSISGAIKFSVYSDKKPLPIIKAQTSLQKINIININPNALTFEVNSTSTSVLSIFQQYNHNLVVKIDGVKKQLLKMNIAFTGVEVPAGKSTIQLSYKPSMVIKGIFLSLATIVLIIFLFSLKTVRLNRNFN